MKSSPSTSPRRRARASLRSAPSARGTARHCSTSLPSCQMAKPTSGRARAWRRTDSMQCASSVASLLRNLRRAGVLKNSSLTSSVVPRLRGAGRSSPLRASSSQALSSPSRRERMLVSDTEAMAASASPRKPMVPTCSSSCRSRILLVAWRRSATGSSSRGMPQPSSSTAISRTPPASRRTVIWVAPASRALSTSSRTTEAGRSTTSPAAIWLMSSSGRSWMARRGAAGAKAVIDRIVCSPFGALRQEVFGSRRDQRRRRRPSL